VGQAIEIGLPANGFDPALFDGLRVSSSRPCSGANEHRPDARPTCRQSVYLGFTFLVISLPVISLPRLSHTLLLYNYVSV